MKINTTDSNVWNVRNSFLIDALNCLSTRLHTHNNKYICPNCTNVPDYLPSLIKTHVTEQTGDMIIKNKSDTVPEKYFLL